MQNNVPTSPALRVIERISRADAETLDYQATIEDREIFTRPWTVRYPLRRNPEYVMYEYACHEGNYALANLITGSQAEQAAQRASKP
jgi:hypothetical protein